MEALPPGWTEQVDPGSGNKFYHNAGTGETAWERPSGALPAAGPGAGALPEGWAEQVDPGSGRTFYFKAATGETTWDRPASTQPVAASADAAAGGAGGGLPEGWAEYQDPGSGRTFYHKASTGETAWEKPQNPAQPAAAPASAAASALPEGWAEQVDPGSGRTFYFKAATGETTWDRPEKPKGGSWSTEQAWNLGQQPKQGLSERVQVLDRMSWSSVMKTVDALNAGALIVDAGMCVIYSASKDSYWLLWRSDRSSDAESLNEVFSS